VADGSAAQADDGLEERQDDQRLRAKALGKKETNAQTDKQTEGPEGSGRV
jgi:hypothetical protein